MTDSQTNRTETIRLVALIASDAGMHDDTDAERATLSSRAVSGGYSLLAAYSETSNGPRKRITLWATADQGLLTTSLHQAKARKARTERYAEIEEALTNTLRTAFGQSVRIRTRDYVVP